ncbi:unnamed protein product, partial [Choristocarpus tenellus]
MMQRMMEVGRADEEWRAKGKAKINHLDKKNFEFCEDAEEHDRHKGGVYNMGNRSRIEQL